jgi:hypothetical protein
MIFDFGLGIFGCSGPRLLIYEQYIKGAIGFDREVRIIEACRVTAYPQISGN